MDNTYIQYVNNIVGHILMIPIYLFVIVAFMCSGPGHCK